MAEHAEFFSFGTNDLTQMTFGFSRDDVEARIMPPYLERHLLEVDPFETSSTTGVGQLMQMAVEAAGRPTPTSRWASAASTAATRPPSRSATSRPGLRVLLAVPVPSPAWRRPTRRWIDADR
jgi:pyruvate, orthophosphate dikinase